MQIKEIIQTAILNGQIAKLCSDHGVKAVFHTDLPLVKFDYVGWQAKKSDLVANYCRGVVFDTETGELVAKGFSRFFNYGENLEITDQFDFSNFYTQEKLDGSMIMIYKYRDQVCIDTRGSFGNHILAEDKTWYQIVWSILTDEQQQFVDSLQPGYCLVFEFCSLYNKIVARHLIPKLVLLACFDYEKEINTPAFLFERPSIFSFDEVEEARAHFASEEKTFEGFVLCDTNGLRLKLKSPQYLVLHRLRGENQEPQAKDMITLLHQGEVDEFLTYFPEYEALFRFYEQRLEDMRDQFLSIAQEVKPLMSIRKEFALKVKDLPFSSLCFLMLRGREPEEIWASELDTIIKILT